jgi:hypothetical protein
MACCPLRLHDHVEDDELLVTQKVMAELLGVRSSVLPEFRSSPAAVRQFVEAG